ILGACGGPTHVVTAPSTPSHVEAAADLESKTIALVGRTDDGELRPFCTGVWVSGSSILTARHCVDDGKIGDDVEYAVRGDIYAPGELHVRERAVARSAKILALDDGHDLALLRAPGAPPHGVAATSLEPVQPGAFAQTVGHSFGMWWSYSSGD